MKIKICGITNIDDAKYCADLGADAVGFIFYDKSRRYIKTEEVKNIISQLPPLLIKVGVFVNEEIQNVNLIAKEAGLNIVQLHGNESSEYLNEINYPIIKAFRVNNDFDFKSLNQYKNCSFLLDSFHKDEYGGTGLKFDWEKIPIKLRRKIILAGGVSVENIEVICSEINPYAIDVSSSVELSPGKKDHQKLKNLFERINEIRNKKC